MKLPFADKLNISGLKKLFSKRRNQLTHPYRDWKLLLLGFVGILLVLVSWSTYLFWKIKEGGLFVSTPTPPVIEKKINPALLKEVLDFHKNRENTYNKLIEEIPDLSNPAK